MKVKNIMFSGFAAAILMGTVSANAATTAFQIASKAYVDSKASTGLVDESTGNPISVADALAGKADAADVESLETSVGTLTGNASTAGSVAEAKAAADAAQADVDALEEAVGNGFSAQNTVADAIGAKADAAALGSGIGTGAGEKTVAVALAEKVNVSDKATSIRTVAGGASDDKWATERAVAAQIEGITGGAGTVDQQIAAALGDDFTGQDAYTTVTAALADKADASDVSTLSSTVSGHTTSIGALETAVGDSNNGLVADVAALQTAVGDSNSGLVADVATLQANTTGLTAAKITGYDALAEILNGYSTCIADNANESGHCVLSAHAASGNTPAGMEWVFVTDPWTE